MPFVSVLGQISSFSNYFLRIPESVCWFLSMVTGSLLGEKASRGSKWVTLKSAKKYLSMPVHEGSLPEEVCDVLSITFASDKGW